VAHVVSTVADETDGVEQLEEVTNKLKKRKPAVQGFDLFESSGLMMGVCNGCV